MSEDNPSVTITIHLIHGEPIRVRVTTDEARRLGVSDDLEKAVYRTAMTLVLDGKLLMIPFTSIKHVEIEPAPLNLPVWMLKGNRL